MKSIATQIAPDRWIFRENQQVFDPTHFPARIPDPERWTDEQMQRLFKAQLNA